MSGVLSRLCECHKQPMLWIPDKRCRINHGYWLCATKRQAAQHAYNHSPKKQAANRRNNPKRIRAANVYLGTIGFTDSEIKEMIA